MGPSTGFDAYSPREIAERVERVCVIAGNIAGGSVLVALVSCAIYRVR